MNDISVKNWLSMSDQALAQSIGAFVKHHRLVQNKTQEDVARAANISRSTLSLLEKGEPVSITILIQLLRVLNLLYIMDVFKVEQVISPIELAKLEKQKRQRARNKEKDNTQPESNW